MAYAKPLKPFQMMAERLSASQQRENAMAGYALMKRMAVMDLANVDAELCVPS